MPLENLDVKPEASSPSTGATEDSPPSTNAPLPSTTESLSDGLQAIISDKLKGSSPSDKEAQPSPLGENKQTEKIPERSGETKVEAKQDQPSTQEKGPIPYERFAEVNQQKTDFEKQLIETKPLAEAQQSTVRFCQESGITPDDFRNALEIAALMKRDPGAALAKLDPIVTSLKQFTGDVLPADLQAAVDSGEMALAYAKRLAAAESGRKFGEQRMQLTAAQIEQQKQQTYINDLANNTASWVSSKTATDPDFQPKTKSTEPDGKYEMWFNKFQLSIDPHTVKTASDLIFLATKAYDEVTATVNRFVPPARKGHQTVPSNRSTTSSKQPGSLNEVIASVAAKHGLSFNPSED